MTDWTTTMTAFSIFIGMVLTLAYMIDNLSQGDE